MSRELTERQQKFLSVLFDEANGDVVAAKKLAGYSASSSTTDIIKSLKDEVIEATQLYMSRNAPRAAVAMVGGLLDPTELGIKEKMSAAKELLDRTGLVKTEKMQVESTGGVMLLPPKNNEQELFMKKSLKSYSKDQLISKYNLTEYYNMNKTDVAKIPKIELMEDIAGSGLKDDDEFYAGGLATKKNYVNKIKIVDNLKKKKK